MPFYPFTTAIKSTVIGGSWSTPYGTRFFVLWGDVSLKVPMAALREEYEAWEKLRRERHPEPEPEPHEPAPLPSFPSSSFDWADDVEQEFFSSSSDSNSDDDSTHNTPLDFAPLLSEFFPSYQFDWTDDVEQEYFSSPSSSYSDDGSTTDTTDTDLDTDLDTDTDTDFMDSPIVDQVVVDWISAVGTGTTLCMIPEEDEEEDVTCENWDSDFDWTDFSDWDLIPLDDSTDSTDSNDSDATIMPDGDTTILADGDKTILADFDWTSLDDSDSAPSTASTDTATTVYHILDIDTTVSNFSLNTVASANAFDLSDIKTDDPTATAGLLHAIVFNITAWACTVFLILLATARWSFSALDS